MTAQEGLLTVRLVERIRAWRGYHEFELKSLSRRLGLSDNTLRLIDTDRWNPTLSTLCQIEAAIEPEFDDIAAGIEYRMGVARVQGWVDFVRASRNFLLQETRWRVTWKEVVDIHTDEWRPSWRTLRRLLPLVPDHFNTERQDFDGKRKRPRKTKKNLSAGTAGNFRARTTAETGSGPQQQSDGRDVLSGIRGSD